MVTRRKLLRATGAAGGVSLVAGCSNLIGGGDDDDRIVIGGLQPFSGPFAIYGEMHQAGAEFAAQELNDDGGVLDQELAIESSDTESNPREASTTFTRLVERENAVATIGPVSSDVAVNVADAAEEMEVPMFIHAGGDPAEVTEDSRYTFRTANPPAPVSAESFAKLSEERDYETVSAIVADYAWGRAMETSLEELFPDDIELHIEVAPFGESGFTPYLRNLPEDTELLIGTGHPPGVNTIFQQALEIGMDFDLFTAAIAPTTTAIGAVGEDITQGYTTLTQADVHSEEYQSIAEQFYDETGEQFDTGHANGYVTTKLIAQAIEDADSTDPVDISEAVRSIEFDSIYASPIQYTEYGELDNLVQLISGYEMGDTEYPPETDIRPTEVFRSEPIDAYDPTEMPL